MASAALQWVVCNTITIKKYLHIISSTTLVSLAAILVYYLNHHSAITTSMGNWPYAYAINFKVDKLSAIMLICFAIVIWSISIFTLGERARHHNSKWYYVSFWFLVLGIVGTIFTADLFNLYVWIEVTFISTLVLLSISHTRHKTALFRYLILNLIGTFVMLIAVAIIYGVTGTLNIYLIADYWPHLTINQQLLFTLLLFSAFAIKSGLFPWYVWLPPAYPAPQASSSALISGLVTKASMAVMLRLILLWAPLHSNYVQQILVVIALFTMVLGVLGAAIQFEFRRILSFHIVSQLGYIALGIAIGTEQAIVATLYFLMHNIFVKSNLFLVSGYVEQLAHQRSLKKLGDWLSFFPLISIIFFLSAFSLVGFPPLSGFWGKFLLLKSALETHHNISAIWAVAVSLFTLYSMTKIWNYVFCQKNPATAKFATHGAISLRKRIPQYYAMLLLLFASLWIALMPNTTLLYLQATAQQLAHSGVVYV
ncbi:MAG: Na+/H+ antiporter subunit D [Gammaproteobacteria bacterium]